tara:strand:- start:383 stop:1357 length:975 start_codon:yes stop_codon:yes gene_type:complete
MNKKTDELLIPKYENTLFGYDKYFNFFIKLAKQNKLPNQILLSGEAGIGKSTFSYHLVNYFLSKNENFPYDLKNFSINKSNRSFNLVNQNSHPNFFLIDLLEKKRSIDIEQIRNMIKYTNKTTFNENIKFILIDNTEYLNISAINSLLKIVEEPIGNTFFIFIHNSYKKIVNTLKSRCIKFNIAFSNNEKKNILNNIIENSCVDFSNLKNFYDVTNNYYLTPGSIINNFLSFSNNDKFKNIPNIEKLVIDLFNYDFKTYYNNDFKTFVYLLEISLYNKFLISRNKIKIYNLFNSILNKISLSERYNLDIKNLLFELKENYNNAK